MNRFNSDLNMLDMQLPNHAVNVMYIATQTLGGSVLIIVAGPYVAAALAGALIVMVLLQRFYVRGGRELRRLDLTSKSPIYTLFSETIDPDGLRTIRAMRAQQICTDLMTERATASQHPAWLLLAIQKWLTLVLDLTVMVINSVLILIAVIDRHSIGAGLLAIALSQAASMNMNLMVLIVEWTSESIY